MQYLARLASAANLTTALTELASKYNRVRNDFVVYSVLPLPDGKMKHPHLAVSYYVIAKKY